MISNFKSVPASDTIDAIDLICSCLTNRDKELLKIVRNEQVSTVEHQLVARWWNYRPKAGCPLVFKAKVLQILATQGRWLDLLEQLRKHDIFADLLNPDNYKEKNTKYTKAKTLDKRLFTADSSTISLGKSVGRSTGGDGGIDRAYNYGAEWEEADRKRLDAIKLNKEERKLLSSETGEEDDTYVENEDLKWVDKNERLDQVHLNKLNTVRTKVTFGDIPPDKIKENDILIFDASISQSTGASSNELEASSTSFGEGLRRQNFDVNKEKIILADAINNIQNIEFVDVRERFYRYFDTLFYLDKKTCQ